MIYLGIDPGQSGGLAWVPKGDLGPTYPEFVPMPTTERDVYEQIDCWLGEPDQYGKAFIEHVHAMPKQGVSSSFKFGMGYGGLRMALVACGIPFQEVRPRTWQKGLGITPRKKTESKLQFKDRLRAKCQQLFPDLEVWNETLGKQRAVCDAILIAEYGRRTDV